MVRNLVLVSAVVIALLVQVSVLDRLPLPGGGGLDLVLLTVVTLALVRGATTGAVIGFWAGLIADILPPADHVVGQYALILSLVGYAAGRAGERAPGAALVTAAACAVGAPLLAAGLAALLGDPRVDAPVLAQMLPPVLIYNLLAAPVVVWVANRVTGRGRVGGVSVGVWR